MGRVRGHYRNGRWVRAHYRRAPRRSSGILEAIGVVVILIIVAAILLRLR